MRNDLLVAADFLEENGFAEPARVLRERAGCSEAMIKSMDVQVFPDYLSVWDESNVPKVVVDLSIRARIIDGAGDFRLQPIILRPAFYPQAIALTKAMS